MEIKLRNVKVNTPAEPLSPKIQTYFANELSNNMYREAGLLNNKLVGIIENDKTLMNFDRYEDLKEIIVRETLKSSNNLAPYMLDYLHATTAENIDNIRFVRNPEIFVSSGKLAKKIQRSRDIFTATYAGSFMNKSVTKQVDETQNKLVKPNISLKGGWERHLNSGACDFCKDQVELYRNTGIWYRHANCRCFKVFVKRGRI